MSIFFPSEQDKTHQEGLYLSSTNSISFWRSQRWHGEPHKEHFCGHFLTTLRVCSAEHLMLRKKERKCQQPLWHTALTFRSSSTATIGTFGVSVLDASASAVPLMRWCCDKCTSQHGWAQYRAFNIHSSAQGIKIDAEHLKILSGHNTADPTAGLSLHFTPGANNPFTYFKTKFQTQCFRKQNESKK